MRTSGPVCLSLAVLAGLPGFRAPCRSAPCGRRWACSRCHDGLVSLGALGEREGGDHLDGVDLLVLRVVYLARRHLRGDDDRPLLFLVDRDGGRLVVFLVLSLSLSSPPGRRPPKRQHHSRPSDRFMCLSPSSPLPPGPLSHPGERGSQSRFTGLLLEAGPEGPAARSCSPSPLGGRGGRGVRGDLTSPPMHNHRLRLVVRVARQVARHHVQLAAVQHRPGVHHPRRLHFRVRRQVQLSVTPPSSR